MKQLIIILLFIVSYFSFAQEATWKKTSDGKNFIFSVDGLNISNYCSANYMNNDLLVYYPTKKQLFICTDFKIKNNNTVFNAEVLAINTQNGFWFKTDKGGANVFSANGKLINKSKQYEWASNKIDVIYRGEQEIYTLVLENFKNVNPYQVLQTKLHDDSFITQALINENKKVSYKETTNSDGSKINGFFKNNQPFGPSKITYSNGESKISYYLGSLNKIKHFTYTDKLNGNFTLIDKKENIEVTFLDAKKELIILDLSNNKKTSLTFKNNVSCLAGDCINGIGAYKYDNDAVYIGFFKNNKRHGFGKLVFKNGTMYIGQYVENNKVGLGTYNYPNGDIYLGEWLNNDLHGKGAYYFNSSGIQAGIWEKGSFIKALNKELQNVTLKNNTTALATNSSTTTDSNTKNASLKNNKKTEVKVVKKTLPGYTMLPESGNLSSLKSIGSSDMTSEEYKLGNVGSYNGTPINVALVSFCDKGRKVVFIKATREERRTRQGYHFDYSYTEYYVSIINQLYQHEKVLTIGKDVYLTKTNTNDRSDVKTGYMNVPITISWSSSGSNFNIKASNGNNFNIDTTKCLKN